MSITKIQITCDQVPSDPSIKWSPRKLKFSTTKIRAIRDVAALASHHVMGVLMIFTLFGENMYVRAACAYRIRRQLILRRVKKTDPLANIFSINLDVPYQYHRPRSEKTRRNTKKSKGKRARRSYRRKVRKTNRKTRQQKLKYRMRHMDSTTYRPKKRAHQYLCFRLTQKVINGGRRRHHLQDVVSLKLEHKASIEGEFLEGIEVMFQTPPAYLNLPPAQPVAHQPIGPQRRRNHS